MLPWWLDVADIVPLLEHGVRLDTAAPSYTAHAARAGDEVAVTFSLPPRAATTERGRVDFGHVATEWEISEKGASAVGGHTSMKIDDRLVEFRYLARDLPGEFIAGFAEENEGQVTSAELVPLSWRR